MDAITLMAAPRACPGMKPRVKKLATNDIGNGLQHVLEKISEMDSAKATGAAVPISQGPILHRGT